MLKLNVGSGQRRFEGHGWINLDCVSRPPEQVPDVIHDLLKAPLPYDDVDLIALVHVAEHWLLHDAVSIFGDCYRALKPGGSLIVIVPDIKALAKAWLRGDITDYIYKVNMMGAWQGQEGDSHKWHWTYHELQGVLHDAGFGLVQPFDWRVIPGAESLSRDWWYYGIEATK
jgi:predicted SAM-dependent methyltransferase